MRRIFLLLTVVAAFVGVSASVASADHDRGHHRACTNPGKADEHNKHCEAEAAARRSADDRPPTPEDGDSGDEGYTDGDALRDGRDNCPNHWNPDQKDTDGDGLGDACDRDLDGDGVANSRDNCESTPNPDQRDRDRDGVGDACDSDANGNGRPDSFDDAISQARAASNEAQAQATAARRQAVNAAQDGTDEVFDRLSD